jgi:hypothetical protein
MDHYIYIASSSHWLKEGVIKIGNTSDVAAQLAELRECNPGTDEHRPEILALFRVDNPSTEYTARLVEYCFAVTHTEERIDGDGWYKMAPDDAARYIEDLECTRIIDQ